MDENSDQHFTEVKSRKRRLQQMDVHSIETQKETNNTNLENTVKMPEFKPISREKLSVFIN